MSVTGVFEVEIDPVLGGRWTSLVDPSGRQWLWSRADAARAKVVPGQAFVDAGGVEECFPTITGTPDHGDVWSRSWRETDGAMSVRTGGYELTRTVIAAEAITVDYRLCGPAGGRFVWALHALLDPAPGTRILVSPAQVLTFPVGGGTQRTTWPRAGTVDDFDMLRDDDGSAQFCVLVDVHEFTVCAAGGALRFRIESPGAPTSFGVWQNLGGYPVDAPPYRSFGIEPMLGSAPGLEGPGCEGAAVLPRTGTLTWRVEISSTAPPAALQP